MNTGITAGSLFLEGLLSFFTPCVLPLVPLYIGYLTKDARKEDEEGNVIYDRKRTLFLTAGFVLGICTVFFLAGLGSSALRMFFDDNSIVFQIAGGIILLLSAAVSLHLIRIPFLEKTYQKQMDLSGGMHFFKAYLLGFFFSFAWSPCVGPMLAQAMMLAAQADQATGWLYILSYSAGFILIFLLLGLFTGEVLNLLRKHRGIVKYTGVISGLVIAAMGCYMLYGGFRELRAAQGSPQITVEEEEPPATEEAEEPKTNPTVEEFDFTLNDAAGNPVTLSDKKGKTILVNFFGTWCYYCNLELPGLQKIQETRDDVEIILIAAPGFNGEGQAEEVEKIMADSGYTMQIVYDDSLAVTNMYGVSGYPTTYIIRPSGQFYGYIPGYVEDEALLSYLDDAAKE